MSYVCISAGQCGVQIGQQFWETQLIHAHSNNNNNTTNNKSKNTYHLSPWFAWKPLQYGHDTSTRGFSPRAILVDTEPKVIRAANRHLDKLVRVQVRMSKRRRDNDSKRKAIRRNTYNSQTKRSNNNRNNNNNQNISTSNNNHTKKHRHISVPTQSQHKHKTNTSESNKSNYEQKKQEKTDTSDHFFMDSNLLYEQYGRGNNWALGYYGPNGSECDSYREDKKKVFSSFTSAQTRKHSQTYPETLTHRAMDALRKEAEKCDLFGGCVFMHSVAGGTGSGLGSRLLQHIRDTYAKQYILTCSVTPFCETGETPLQYYNSVLSMSMLQKYADCVLWFSNDDVFRVLSVLNQQQQQTRTLNTRTQTKQVHSRTHRAHKYTAKQIKFSDMNAYIAHCLSNILSPTTTTTTHTRHTHTPAHTRIRLFDMGDFVHSVCPLPSNKYVEVWSTYDTNNSNAAAKSSARVFPTWKSMTSDISRVIPRYDMRNKVCMHICMV